MPTLDICPYCKRGSPFIQPGYSPAMHIQSVWVECPYCELRTIGYSVNSYEDAASAADRALNCFYRKGEGEMEASNQEVELAHALYTRYTQAVGGKAFNGDPLPSAEEFFSDTTKNTQSAAWICTAREAIKLLTPPRL